MFYYHKGLTRAARRTVATAITIAGRQGCTAVDTGHLLLAMLQTGRGTAVEFLRRKQITVTALSACASQRACTGRPLHLRGRDLAPESRKALEFAVLGAHAARVNKAENEHLLCAMLEDTACTASVWLAGLGLEVPRAARECRQLSGQLVLPSSHRMSSTSGSRPSEKYGRDKARLAQEGQLAGMMSWNAGAKFCAAAKRITHAFWGSRAWAKAPWPKPWPSALPPGR